MPKKYSNERIIDSMDAAGYPPAATRKLLKVISAALEEFEDKSQEPLNLEIPFHVGDVEYTYRWWGGGFVNMSA